MLGLDSGVTTIVVALLGGGGLATLITVLLKVRPEAGQFTVNAAESVTLVQTGLIERLEKKLDDSDREIAKLRREVNALYDLRFKVRALEQQNEVLVAENEKLRNQVKHLTGQVDGMNGANSK